MRDGKCEAVQCVTGWSDCSKSCGGGETTRVVFRDGAYVTEKRRCNEQSCPIETEGLSECAPCDNGQWVCESLSCSNGETCQMINLLGDYKCMPNILGECKAWGDPHVVTFDGASNDVYGIGNYTFIELNYTGKESLANLSRSMDHHLNTSIFPEKAIDLRIAEIEAENQPQGGGLFSGIFGSRNTQPAVQISTPPSVLLVMETAPFGKVSAVERFFIFVDSPQAKIFPFYQRKSMIRFLAYFFEISLKAKIRYND